MAPTQLLLDLLTTFDYTTMVQEEPDEGLSFTDPRRYRHRDQSPITKKEIDFLARITRADLDAAILRLAELALGQDL